MASPIDARSFPSTYATHGLMNSEDIGFDKRITIGKKNTRMDHLLQNYYRRKTVAWKRRLLVLLLAGFLAGCAQLPEYARPQFHDPGEGSTIGRDGFGYRLLKIDDFKAPSLPPEFSQYNHHINAHSCISIRPVAGTQALITQGISGGQPFYAGSLPQVSFEAIFVPTCSWWNPEVKQKRKAYILQHEQIHFALAELAARRLTRDAREELRDYLAVDSSYRAVQEELSQKLQDLAHDAMEASFGEHTDFDEDTSLHYDPRAQRRWLEEVEERLAEEHSP